MILSISSLIGEFFLRSSRSFSNCRTRWIIWRTSGEGELVTIWGLGNLVVCQLQITDQTVVDGSGRANGLGIDAPVPGIMAPSYDLDFQQVRNVGSKDKTSIAPQLQE